MRYFEVSFDELLDDEMELRLQVKVSGRPNPTTTTDKDGLQSL
jgi:hypothetical protein